MNYLEKILGDFEIHAVQGIRACFENGIDPNLQHNGKPLIYELINMYLRGPNFKECIRTFVDFGLKFEDEVLLAVLLDDHLALDKLLINHEELLEKKYTLQCTFTPLFEASLLHICAEYGHLKCAKTLIEHGANINAKAGVDQNGFGGQTPIFHTVNQHNNECLEVMKFLISQGADLNITLKGLIWGKNYEWETFIPAVNPISYAMMGLLRQFQRTEPQIYEAVNLLMKANFVTNYYPANVPNKYLNS